MTVTLKHWTETHPEGFPGWEWTLHAQLRDYHAEARLLNEDDFPAALMSVAQGLFHEKRKAA